MAKSAALLWGGRNKLYSSLVGALSGLALAANVHAQQPAQPQELSDVVKPQVQAQAVNVPSQINPNGYPIPNLEGLKPYETLYWDVNETIRHPAIPMDAEHVVTSPCCSIDRGEIKHKVFLGGRSATRHGQARTDVLDFIIGG